MNTITDLLNDIFVSIPGCTTPLMTQQLQLTARDFCEETEAWTETLDPIDVVDGTSTYDLNPKCNASVHRILEVRYGEDATDEDTTPLAVDKYKLISERQIELHDEPTDDITDGLSVKVVLRPTWGDSIDLPDWMIDRWGRYLIAGTKARLMMMPKKGWTDPQLAQIFRREYEDGINNATYDSAVDNRSANLVLQLQGWL